jgi:tight adherence protein B
MNEELFIYLLFFMSAAFLILGVYQYYARDHATQKKINRRMALIETTASQAEALQILRRERGGVGLWSLAQFHALQDLFVQSGVNFQDARFLLALCGLASITTATLAYLLGFHLYTLPVGLALTLALLNFWLSFKVRRRISRFSEQLPDVLDIIVRSLKAGHPLTIALSLAGREMPDPAGTEFGIASDEVTFGLDITTAMSNMSKRVGAPDLLFVITSISVQAQSGGNLGEVLSRLSRLIRERFRMRRKVTALTAEGRMSATILTALPVVIFLIVSRSSPQYFGQVWDDPAFHKAMGAAALLLCAGNFIMRRMANFKF